MFPSEIGRPMGFNLYANGASWFQESSKFPPVRAATVLSRSGNKETLLLVLLCYYTPGYEGPDAMPITLLNRL